MSGVALPPWQLFGLRQTSPGLYSTVNGDLQKGLHQGRPSQTVATIVPNPVVSPCQSMPPQDTLQHQQVVLVQSPVGSLLLSSRYSYAQDFVCALQDWSLCFPQYCGGLVIKSCWPSRSDSLGIPSPFVRSPAHPPGRYGIWFYHDCTPPTIML